MIFEDFILNRISLRVRRLLLKSYLKMQYGYLKYIIYIDKYIDIYKNINI